VRLFVAIYPPADAVDHVTEFVAGLHVGRAYAAGVNTRLAPRETYHLTVAFLGEVPDAHLTAVEAAITAAVTSWHAHAARDLRRAARVAADDPRRAARGDLRGDAGVAAGDLRRAARGDLRGDAGDPGRAALGDLRRAARGSPATDADADADSGDLVVSAAAPRAETVKGSRKPRDRGDAGKAPQVWVGGGGRFGRGRFSVLWAGVHGETERLATLTRAVRRELRRARLPYDERPWKPHLTIARPGDRVDRAQLGADRAALAAYHGPPWSASELVLVRSHLGPKPSYDRLTGWPL
jgi:2'-5' RNA ligase